MNPYTYPPQTQRLEIEEALSEITRAIPSLKYRFALYSDLWYKNPTAVNKSLMTCISAEYRCNVRIQSDLQQALRNLEETNHD